MQKNWSKGAKNGGRSMNSSDELWLIYGRNHKFMADDHNYGVATILTFLRLLTSSTDHCSLCTQHIFSSP